jgi:hypothetical protein
MESEIDFAPVELSESQRRTLVRINEWSRSGVVPEHEGVLHDVRFLVGLLEMLGADI